MKTLFGSATLALLLVFSLPAHAADAPAPAAEPLQPHVLGSPNAPVTVDEYVSLTCPHCAEFYNEIMPDLKTRYVDTGKVKFVLHEFARDGVDLKAFTLARCMPDDEFYPFISVLFRNQINWIASPDPMKILLQYAQLGGLPADKAKACLADTKVQDSLAAAVKEDGEKLGINATPTFIVNPGNTRFEGLKQIPEFSNLFDKLLAANAKK